MLIENMVDKTEIHQVVLHLDRREAAELRDALNQLIASPKGWHEHILNSDFTREIAVVATGA